MTVSSFRHVSYFHCNSAFLSHLSHFLFKKPLFCFYLLWFLSIRIHKLCLIIKLYYCIGFSIHFSAFLFCVLHLRFSFSHLLVWCSFDAFSKSIFGGNVQKRNSLPVTASKWLFSRCQLKSWNSESYNSFEKLDGLSTLNEVICLTGNNMWSVNLTWDFTWQPIFLPTRPYKPPYVLHQTEATSQVIQRSLKSICWAHNLRAVREICFCSSHFGSLQMFTLLTENLSQYVQHLQCDCISRQVAKYQLSEQSVAK